MKFRPLHDRVVVKRIDAEEKSKGGIIIPDTAQEKPSQGEIIAIGPGGRDEAGKLIPIDVRVSDQFRHQLAVFNAVEVVFHAGGRFQMTDIFHASRRKIVQHHYVVPAVNQSF